jgi:hypothetical protein
MLLLSGYQPYNVYYSVSNFKMVRIHKVLTFKEIGLVADKLLDSWVRLWIKQFSVMNNTTKITCLMSRTNGMLQNFAFF